MGQNYNPAPFDQDTSVHETLSYITAIPDSPSACSEYSCSSCRTKTSVLPHYACSHGFALASGPPQN